MNVIETKTLSLQQKLSIIRLWNQEYPHQLMFETVEDLDNYLIQLIDLVHYFVLGEGHQIIAWASLFERNREKWFAIIVGRNMQGNGLGTSLLNMLKTNETLLNGWLIDQNNYLRADGTQYQSPAAFYLKNGFTICLDTRLEAEKLSAIKIKWHSDIK